MAITSSRAAVGRVFLARLGSPAARVGLQVIAYAAFASVLGIFSSAPTYQLRGEDAAIVKLSFSHAAQLRYPCRERSESELAKLAPNMRTKQDCPRERAEVRVELDMDGAPLYRIATPPAGLRKDGAATVYRRAEIPAGSHTFAARLADGVDGAFAVAHQESIVLEPGQVLVVDFTAGQFVFVHR